LLTFERDFAVPQRASTNPILASPNRLRLGIFGINISSGLALTLAEGRRHQVTEKLRHYYAAVRGDDPCVENVIRVMGIQAQTLPPSVTDELKFHFKAGFAGIPLVGTAEFIVDRMQQIAEVGFDGVLLGWLDYAEGLRRWNREIAPLLVQAGLRHPVR
jgi:FMNH2-dependent dimethyl sulfone monooxygenase